MFTGLFSGFLIHATKHLEGEAVAWHFHAVRNNGLGGDGDYWLIRGEFFASEGQTVSLTDGLLTPKIAVLEEEIEPEMKAAIVEAVEQWSDLSEERIGE